MKLIEPSLEYKSEFEAFYEDFAKNDEVNSGFYQPGIDNFAAYIQQITDEAAGINVQQGYVPCSHFWLVDDSKNIIGAIRVRHHIDNDYLSLEGGHIGYDIAPSFREQGFGTAMLKLVLPKAKALGIEKALIVADEDNLASRGVIEANGGELEKIVVGRVYPEPLARYWIQCG
ncbi:GNAT family N-acetyltransferase [Vibrio sp. JC009]|uniref:GNAT family N-acetyltransferase n=1 Tax=Vibrio sp. JC009 TaxID=2912314 RepID=UPI0023AF5553|nr:GNAT family N-acetyltransferase [Vibrio sp. JC009]WED21412.1 GNAT family N-acetyltransferase [Vibrio sp. JC009]